MHGGREGGWGGGNDLPKVTHQVHGEAQCKPSILHFEAGRVSSTTWLSWTPKSLHTVALSPASCLITCPLAKIEEPSGPPLHCMGPIQVLSPPSFKPLLLSTPTPCLYYCSCHMPHSRQRPTYTSLPYLVHSARILPKTLSSQGTTEGQPTTHRHCTTWYRVSQAHVHHGILEATLSLLLSFIKDLPGAVLGENRPVVEHRKAPDPARLRDCWQEGKDRKSCS